MKTKQFTTPCNMDHIDLIICRVFKIDPNILTRRTREGRLVLARFTGMHIRASLEFTTEQICGIYDRERSAVANGIKTINGMLEVDPLFKRTYDLCIHYINGKKAPYSRDLIKVGAKVWTRTDSVGNVTSGVVTGTNKGYFHVQSVNDPSYWSINRLEDGRIASKFETSRDIVLVET